MPNDEKPGSSWTKPPKKPKATKKTAEQKLAQKAAAQKKGGEYTVKRRTTARKVREDKAQGRLGTALGDEPALMNALDLLMPGEEVEELTGYAKQGRGPTFRHEYIRIAETICSLGGTDIEVARALGVSLSTMWGWQSRNEDFFRAMIVGKDLPDERVVRALYNRAVGYNYPQIDIKIVGGEAQAFPQIVHIPPDVNACKSWLRSRRRDEWSETTNLNLSSDELFKQLWTAVGQGQTLPMEAEDVGQ